MSPRPHHGAHIIYEGEEQDRSLKQIGERLQKIGELIGGQGYFRMNERDVKPPDPCKFILRFERLHRGELSLKIELKWEEHGSHEGLECRDEVVIS